MRLKPPKDEFAMVLAAQGIKKYTCILTLLCDLPICTENPQTGNVRAERHSNVRSSHINAVTRHAAYEVYYRHYTCHEEEEHEEYPTSWGILYVLLLLVNPVEEAKVNMKRL